MCPPPDPLTEFEGILLLREGKGKKRKKGEGEGGGRKGGGRFRHGFFGWMDAPDCNKVRRT